MASFTFLNVHIFIFTCTCSANIFLVFVSPSAFLLPDPKEKKDMILVNTAFFFSEAIFLSSSEKIIKHHVTNQTE